MAKRPIERRRVVLDTRDADGRHLTVTQVDSNIPGRAPTTVWLVHRDMRFLTSYKHRPTAADLFGHTAVKG